MAVDQRNFGNVIDINGTEVNVEDKRLAELAGQTPKSSSQISTSSQYVPLQDTDGNIVKISPASFQEAVRNTLASLLVNNDKGTSFSQVPVIGSGDFGSASLANLASVLGAGKCQYIRDTALYKLTNGIEAYRGVTIKVDYTRNDDGQFKWGEEIAVGKTTSVFVSTKGIYAGSRAEYTTVKLYKNSTDVFIKVQSTAQGGSLTINSPLLIEVSSVDVSTLTEVDWGKDVYCGYTSLPDLASALGVPNDKHTLSNTDLNTLWVEGSYYLGSNNTNLPSGVSSGILTINKARDSSGRTMIKQAISMYYGSSPYTTKVFERVIYLNISGTFELASQWREL